MNHKRLITIAPGEAYQFSVTVPELEGASLTFDDLDGGITTVRAGESVEVRVEARPKPQAAAIERKVA